MSKNIDISMKISNKAPTVTVVEGVVLTVNNRKNNILLMQAEVKKRSKEAEKLAKEATERGEEYESNTEMELMDFTLKALVGEKGFNEIEELDLPFPEYKVVYKTIMAVATGTEVEEERFQE